MITKDNIKLYSSLFADINKALGYDESKYIPVSYSTQLSFSEDTREKFIAIVNEDTGETTYQVASGFVPGTQYFVKVLGISDIDDYFMEIENIKNYVIGSNGDANNPENDPYFLILPIDEPIFEINANTRTIEVPRVFSDNNNGIAVQGDHLSEILYFAIDRYFDTADLYEKDIFIQWEGPKPASQNEAPRGLHMTINKSLAYMPGKVVFGWPINNEVTEYAGNIRFSVRFYDRFIDNDNQQKLAYSFSTKTATVRVNPALDYNIGNEDAITIPVINQNQLVYDNLRKSTKKGVNNPAVAPVIQECEPEKDIFDLDEQPVFSGRAVFDPEDPVEGYGLISYQWKWTYDKDATDNKVEHRLYEDKPLYKEYEGPKQEQDTYYYKPKGVYITYLGEIPNPNHTIYRKYAAHYPAMAGEYRLIAKNEAGRGNVKETVSDKVWFVPYAENPNFTYPNGKHIKMEDVDGALIGEAKIAVNVNKGELTHQWYWSTREKAISELDESNKLDNEVNTTLSNIVNEGYYYLQSSNKFNEDITTLFSEPVRVTHPPKAPEIVNHLVNGVATENIADLYQVASIGVTVIDHEDVSHDNVITYQWQKYSSSDEDYVSIEGANENEYAVQNAGKYRVVITNTYNTYSISVNSEEFKIFE